MPGFTGTHLDLPGPTGTSLGLPGPTGPYRDLPGAIATCQDLPGPTGPTGPYRTFRHLPHRDLPGPAEAYRSLPGPAATHRGPPGPTCAYRDLPRPTGTCWSLQGPTGIYLDLPEPVGTCRDLLGPTGAYRDLPCDPYRSLPRPTFFLPSAFSSLPIKFPDTPKREPTLSSDSESQMGSLFALLGTKRRAHFEFRIRAQNELAFWDRYCAHNRGHQKRAHFEIGIRAQNGIAFWCPGGANSEPILNSGYELKVGSQKGSDFKPGEHFSVLLHRRFQLANTSGSDPSFGP
jgi:hypothetical protein